LSQAAVVAAALGLARRVGVNGFTMRDLAVELGTTQMAAYHYVKGREELENLLLDEILSGIEVPPVGSGSWHARLRALMENSLSVLRLWSGSGALLLRHRPKRESGRTVSLIGSLLEAGFSDRDAVLAARLLQVWCWGELGLREYLDGNPVPADLLDAAPESLAAVGEISEDDVTAFALDVIVEGLRVRLGCTSAAVDDVEG
jgi:AcrR family transcriptional regulator